MKTSKICIREINENLRRIRMDEPLTKPLRELNESCEFKKKYDELFNMTHEKELEKEVKERMRKYRQKYEQKPEVKERMRKYQQRPEVKERKKKYNQKYYQDK